MKQIVYTCDICNKIIDKFEIYHIKVKSHQFVNYANIDICSNCVKKFKEFVNENIR